MLLISNKHILHLSVATLTPSIQNWHSWTNRFKPIAFIPTSKQTGYRLMHQSTIPTLMVKQIHCQTYSHKCHHMPRTLQKIQPQSLPIPKSTRHFHRIQSKSVQNPAEYSLHQDTEQSKEQHKIAKDPN